MAKSFKIPSVFMAVDKISATMSKMFQSVKNFANKSEAEIAKFERRLRAVSETSKKIAQQSAVVGLALAAPLIIAARDAIAFEDRMAGVQKTTQATNAEMAELGKNILGMAPGTRTSIEELQKIAEIGGQMGIRGVENLTNFTDAVNKFSTALGSDFQGGTEDATRQIASLKNLFKETRGLAPHEAILKVGSAVNELTTIGARADEITEFAKRLGQLPDAAKPSVQSALALGAAFNKVGIPAEIGARGASDVFLTAASNIGAFAKQMGMTEKAASDLMNSKPDQFIVEFAKSLNGLSAEKLAITLKRLKIGDVGAIKTVGALSSNYKDLAKYIGMANEEFVTGASIVKEYNTVNNTTAGKIKQTMNNLQALSITIGTELLPMINSAIKKITPIIKSMIAWAQANPQTVKTILAVVASLSALSFIISGVATVISVVTAAQWAWNIAMGANPIGLITAAIIVFIAEMALLVYYFDEIGAAWLMMMGPIGMLIQMIRTFSKEWENIKAAFGVSFIDGIKQIGATFLEYVLWPLQQILNVIAFLTKADWAVSAADALESFRGGLGVDLDKPTNPKATEAAVQKSISEEKQSVGILIKDDTGRASVQNGNQLGIPVTLSTTWGGFSN